MARGIAAPMVRGPTGYRLISGGLGPRLDLFSGGTFTRASEASIWDPDTASLTWVSSNVRRTLGGFLIMEGSRTNILLNSRAPTGGSSVWTAGSGVTVESTDASPAPDSGESSDRMAINSGGYGRYKSFSAAASTAYAVSMLASRMPGAGSGPWQGSTERTDTEGAYANGTLAEGWTRKGWLYTPTTTATHYFLPWEGRTRTYGTTATAVDYLYDLGQIEAGQWPSSPIRTLGSPVTRSADALSYAVGQYPASFLTRGFRFTFVPDFSSAEWGAQAGGTRGSLIGTAGTVGNVDFRSSAGSCTLRYTSGAGAEATIAVTFSRGQPITVTADYVAMTFTIAGATTGNGSYAITQAFPADVLSINSATAPVFGRYSQYVEAL